MSLFCMNVALRKLFFVIRTTFLFAYCLFDTQRASPILIGEASSWVLVGMPKTSLLCSMEFRFVVRYIIYLKENHLLI